MDRKWMYLEDRSCKKYRDGVESFLQVAVRESNRKNETCCPCRECKRLCIYELDNIEHHLHRHGFAFNHKRWTFHGEEVEFAKGKPADSLYAKADEDRFEEEDVLALADSYVPTSLNNILESLGGNGSSNFASLFEKAHSPLYPGSRKMLTLDFLRKMMHLKLLHCWSEESFDMILLLLNEALPEGAKLPASHHDAKKLLQDLGLGYELIHTCKYDCALFWKENSSCDKCPICDEPRYKYDNGNGKKVPQKVLYYFPLKPRLQSLFKSKDIAADMRWHKEKRVGVDGV